MMQFTLRSSTVLKYLIYNFTFEAKAISIKLLFTVLILVTQSKLKVKNDHRSEFLQFKQLERRSLKKKKNQGFNWIRTRDLRVAGALLYQLSHEATHWERGQFIELYQFREGR